MLKIPKSSFIYKTPGLFGQDNHGSKGKQSASVMGVGRAKINAFKMHKPMKPLLPKVSAKPSMRRTKDMITKNSHYPYQAIQGSSGATRPKAINPMAVTTKNRVVVNRNG